MSILKHDEDGFLIGKVINEIKRSDDELVKIGSDISAIKKFLFKNSIKSSKKTNIPTPKKSHSINNVRNRETQADNKTSTSKKKAIKTNKGSSRVSANASVNNTNRKTVETKTNIKVANAVNEVNKSFKRKSTVSPRVKSKNEEVKNGRDALGRFVAGSGKGKNGSANNSIIKGATGNVNNTLKAAGDGLEKVDPSIKAFKEISEPLKRGFGMLFNKDRGDTPILKKIFRSLSLSRKENSLFHKASKESLKEIEDNTDRITSNKKGFFSFLSPLLGLKKGLITAVTAGLAGLAGLSGLATALLGKYFGNHNTVPTIPQTPIRTTTTTTQPPTRPNTRGGGLLRKGIDIAKAGFNLFLGSKVKALITAAVLTAVYAYTKTTDKDSQSVDNVKQNIFDFAIKGLSTFANGIEKVNRFFKGDKLPDDKRLGAVSRMNESGRHGASAISSGKGDNGGQSYGAYQLSSKTGTLNKFLSGSKFKGEFDGLKVGSDSFNNKWRGLSKNKEFNDEQHQFIKETHYDKQLNKLKDNGIDLSNRGRAVKEAIWSTSVQFGGNTGLISNALKGKDTNKISDSAIISAIQNYKIKNNSSLFKSSPNLQQATLNRAINEKHTLLGMNRVNNSQSPNTTLSNAQSLPKVPSYTPSKIPAQQSNAQQQNNKEQDKTPISVIVDKGDVNQDLSDRKIAHIATGGYL